MTSSYTYYTYIYIYIHTCKLIVYFYIVSYMYIYIYTHRSFMSCIHLYVYYTLPNRYGSLLVTWETADLCSPSPLVRLAPHIRSLCFGFSWSTQEYIKPVSCSSIGGSHFHSHFVNNWSEGVTPQYIVRTDNKNPGLTVIPSGVRVSKLEELEGVLTVRELCG